MKGYTIILVRDLRTGRIENHQLFESTALSAESLAKREPSGWDAVLRFGLRRAISLR
jgi:hypothetical protein